MGKVSDLTADLSPTADDLLMLVNDPAGVPASRRSTVAQTLMGVPGIVDVVVTGAVSAGAAATLVISLQANDLSATAIAHEIELLLITSAGGVGTFQYAGPVSLSGNVAYSAATTGSIINSGTGWALVKTSATGAFGCTLTNAVDETAYVSAATPSGGVDALAQRALVAGCTPGTVQWIP